MRFETLSVLATFAAGGFQLVAADDAPEHSQSPRYYFPKNVKRTVTNVTYKNAEESGIEARNSGGGIASFLNGINGALNGGDSSESTSSSSKNGKEVVVVVSQDREGHLHTLTTSTRAGAKPTDSAVTSTQFHDDSPASSPSPAAATPSSTPPTTTDGSGNVLDLGADLNAILNPNAGSKSADSSTPDSTTPDSTNSLSTPATPSVTPSTSTDGSGNILDLGSDVKKLGDGLGDAVSGVGNGLSKGVSAVGAGLSSVVHPTADSTTGSSTPLTTGSSQDASSTGSTSDPGLLEKLLGDKSSTSSSASTTDPGLLEKLLGDKSKSSSSASGTIPVSVPASPSASPSSSFDPIGDLVDGVSGLLNGTSSNTQPLIPTPSLPLSIPKPSKSLGGVPTASIPLSGSPTNPVGSIPVPHAPSTGPSGKPFGSGSGASGTGSVPTPTGPALETSNVVPAPSSTPLPKPVESSTTSSTAEPQTTSTVKPSSTDDDWMPSTILVLPTHHAPEPTSTNTNSQSEPTSLPGSITPNNPREAPENSLLLQLGFDSNLPWSFVATTPLSSSQIFKFIPKALAYALPQFGSVAAMYALEPYFNWQQTGYNATIAVFYFPREGLDALKKLHSNPNSALYKDSDDQAVTSLMTMIDSTIPLVYNGNYPSQDGGSGSTGNGGDSGSGNGSNNNNNVDGGSNSSSKGKASAAGIATGAVAGAAAYGAAMFWVARRYRKRRQLHQRASSTGDAMSQNSAGASAAGGSQRTARSQMISAPVMAENSLGWN